MTSRRSLSLLLVALAGCGPALGAGGTPDSLKNLPPRHDPPIDLADDDDLGRARGMFDALALDDPSRPAKRKELWAAYQARIDRLKADTRDDAFTRFELALGLWDARELMDPKGTVADLALAEPIAAEMYKSFSTSGADREAVTAMIVLQAAHPERTAEYDKTWADIVSYTDDLAVAEAGAGAERSRAIVMLESATQHFPSWWALDKLIQLYLQRQDTINTAILSGNKQGILGAHRDPGVIRPIWNILRAYVRGWRVDQAPPVLDKLTGQFGDEPEIRKRVHEAVDHGDGRSWLALMAAYLPSEGREDGDAATALTVCEIGGEKLPKAIEPRKCVAELARVTDRPVIALHWVEEARKLAPDDRQIAETAGRLYLARVADNIQAERLDAAKLEMKGLEEFYADVAKRWPGKPLDTTLADAYLTFGRGLFNLGEIEGALSYIDKADKLSPSPQATEERATIALKTGHFVEAAKGYEAASAAKRPTPIETSFEGARLRRLAGEAWREAGDARKARALFDHSMKDWEEILGAALNPRLRSTVFAEVARLYYDEDMFDKAMQGFNAAIDADAEQAGVYGDVIAFLVTRGHYAEALDAYHRALARPEITEYLKVYTSLWIVDFGKIRGADPDSEALDYLKTAAKGDRWYHQLARFELGKLTFDQLVAKADTRGRRAEAYFYEALDRYARGARPKAEELLKEVVATQMLGFFEYDMASYFLKNGPPVDAKKMAAKKI